MKKKLFLVFNWYGDSYGHDTPSYRDVFAIFEDEDECKKYVESQNSLTDGGIDYFEVYGEYFMKNKYMESNKICVVTRNKDEECHGLIKNDISVSYTD